MDWSGARGAALPGLQVARCRGGSRAPALVANPAGGAWSRLAFARWLAAEFDREPETLCGLDFAFAFPYCDRGSYFPGAPRQPSGVRGLWRMVETACAGDADLYGGRFVIEPPFAAYFLDRARRGERYAPRLRVVDGECRRQGAGHPEPVFKAVGAAQVAKASLSGMRFLHWCRRHLPGLVVWPFERPRSGTPLIVEIYPWAYLGRADERRKVRDLGRLNTILAALGSRPVAPAALAETRAIDHKTDALVAAAALRTLAPRGETWRPPALSPETRRREGWIFGVD